MHLFPDHTIERVNSNELRITKSKSKESFSVLMMGPFWIVWYSVLLDKTEISTSGTIIIFYLAPLFSLPEILRSLGIILSGQTFEFKKKEQVVLLNGKLQCKFDEIDRIQIRILHDSDGPDSYNLSIVKRDETKLRINQTQDKEQVQHWADDIADFTNKSVKWKK